MNQYGRIKMRHVAAPDLKQDSNRNLNQISIQSLEIHNFQSVTQKITNNIPLETLRHVESNGAIIFHSFSN
jgi:hypothetical protein